MPFSETPGYSILLSVSGSRAPLRLRTVWYWALVTIQEKRNTISGVHSSSPDCIDAHVHIESSLLTPREYARLVVRHGTTTVIADPHEIANVAGTPGIDFMLDQREAAGIDILYLLPSCVPATPEDVGGATLTARDLRPYAGRYGILGLGEMMNVPGVLAADPPVLEKLPALFCP